MAIHNCCRKKKECVTIVGNNSTIYGMIINGFFECIRLSKKSVKYGMHVGPMALHNGNNRKIIKNLKRVKKGERGNSLPPDDIFCSNACTFTMLGDGRCETKISIFYDTFVAKW